MAEVKQLGKTPDSVLATRTGRTIKEVTEERQQRRIRLCTPPRRWTAREIKLLGKYNDYELGRRLRRPSHQIKTRRNLLKIPPFKPKAATKVWRPEEIALLGRFSDTEVARRLGCPRHVVSRQRHKLKIPGSADGRRHWTLEEDRLVGTMTDVALARRLNRTVESVAHRRRQKGLWLEGTPRRRAGMRKKSPCSESSRTKKWRAKSGVPWRPSGTNATNFASPRSQSP